MRGVVIIGAGPAGLMAAETLAQAGVAVTVVDANPRPGRKFLVAGKSGLNLTHSEPLKACIRRYGEQAPRFATYLEVFPPAALRAWADSLGAETYVGTSGRVFPRLFKGANLLAAWIERLTSLRVRFLGRHRLTDLQSTPEGPVAVCTGPRGERRFAPRAVILALGGATWTETGSDGAWTALLAKLGVPLKPFRPANVGMEVAWPPAIADLEGSPLKTIALHAGDGEWVRGEAVVTAQGLEGGGIYAVSRTLRDRLDAGKAAILHLDLKPDLLPKMVEDRCAGMDVETAAKRLKLAPAAAALLAHYRNKGALARSVKDLHLPIVRTRPLAEAISSAGGVPFEACDPGLQLKAAQGIYVCGEMLDWEAPTGGYLLTGCAATGVWAGRSILSALGLPLTTPAVHSPLPLPQVSR